MRSDPARIACTKLGAKIMSASVHSTYSPVACWMPRLSARERFQSPNSSLRATLAPNSSASARIEAACSGSLP